MSTPPRELQPRRVVGATGRTLAPRRVEGGTGGNGGNGGGPTLLEGWESDNPLDPYTGDKSAYTVQQSTVYAGSNALEATASSGETIFVQNHPNGTLTRGGDPITCRVRLTADGNNRAYVGVFYDGTDRYEVTLETTDSDFKIQEQPSGDDFDTVSIDYSPYLDQWLLVRITSTDSEVSAELLDENETSIAGPVTAVDADITGGGWAFKMNNINSGDPIYYD